MATVKLQNGNVILKDGKVSCSCCECVCPYDEPRSFIVSTAGMFTEVGYTGGCDGSGSQIWSMPWSNTDSAYTVEYSDVWSNSLCDLLYRQFDDLSGDVVNMNFVEAYGICGWAITFLPSSFGHFESCPTYIKTGNTRDPIGEYELLPACYYDGLYYYTNINANPTITVSAA